MRIATWWRGAHRTLVLIGFAAICAALFGWYWIEGGGSVPGVTSAPSYTVSFTDPDVLNLADFGSVEMAGVPIGRVEALTTGPGGAHVVIGLNQPDAPLHQGATVRVGIRSLQGPSYVDVVDGKGAPIPAGTALPPSAVQPTVDLRTVLASLSPQTRQQLSSVLQSLGAGTTGSQQSISQLMSALGTLGTQGYTVVDDIATQSADLQQLVANTSTLLKTLNTGQGQIANVVRNAQTIVGATAGQQQAIAGSVQQLPALLGNVTTASGRLTQLAQSLAPIASNLRVASPDLNNALLQLPGTVTDLHNMLPSLNGVLDEAPATLNRVPALGSDVQNLVPAAQFELSDITPMLAYIEPYGHDLAAFITNFGAAFDHQDESGYYYMALSPVLNEDTVKESPLRTNNLGLTGENAYPSPGRSTNLQPLSGPPPHVNRESR